MSCVVLTKETTWRKRPAWLKRRNPRWAQVSKSM